MVALKGRDSGSEDQQIDVLAQDSVGLEDMADSAWQRRDSQRCVPGRHMASQEGRRAGRRSGRPYRRLAPGAKRVRVRLGGADAVHLRSQDGDLRHLAALRGGKGGVARHERAAMHLPRGRPGQALYDPEVQARGGVELLGIANSLKDAGFATVWLLEYSAWCTKWATFLKEFTVKDGRRVYTHERLREARKILNKLVKDGTLFTFVEMQQEYGGEWSSTNNAVESVNARLQDVFRHHRGLFAPAPCQGDLLVVLHAHGKPAAASGYHPRHADRRRGRRPVRDSIIGQETRRRRARRIRHGDSLERVSHAHELQAVNNQSGHTF